MRFPLALTLTLLAPMAGAATIQTVTHSDGIALSFKTSDPANCCWNPMIPLSSYVVPWSFEATGHVDTEALTWILDSVTVSDRPTGSLAVDYGPMTLIADYDPPGFEPPTFPTLEGVTLTSTWTWGALQLEEPLARTVPVDPRTLRASIIWPVDIGHWNLTYSGGERPLSLDLSLANWRGWLELECNSLSLCSTSFDMGTEQTLNANLPDLFNPPVAVMRSDRLETQLSLMRVESLVPEPSAIWLLLGALSAAAARRWRSGPPIAGSSR